MSQELRIVRLPESLCALVEKRWHSRFDRIDDLLAFLLKELSRDEITAIDRAEEQLVEQRLRDLGYI